MKLTCGNENQDNKYVVQMKMRHHCEFWWSQREVTLKRLGMLFIAMLDQ